MDKKMYNKPEMKVVLLRHRTSLLQSTGTNPDPQNPDSGPGARRFDWDD